MLVLRLVLSRNSADLQRNVCIGDISWNIVLVSISYHFLF